MEEIVQQEHQGSLREYLDVMRRRKAIIIQTFVLVLVVGVIVTLLTKPVYRTGGRILVEGKVLALAQYNANDPMSNIFMPPAGYDVSTQIEVLQSQKVLADVYKAAGIPDGSVHLEIKQVKDTNVIEFNAEAHDPKYAEGFARVLPKTYLGYVTNNRKAEVTSALKFARERLQDEGRKLTASEKELRLLRRLSGIYSIDEGRKARLQEVADAQNDSRKAGADVDSQSTRLAALVAERHAQPQFIETPTYSTNPQIDAIRTSIATLKTQRSGMLIKFKPTSTQVQEIDAQIADLDARLARTQPMMTTVTKTINPALSLYDGKIADLRNSMKGAQADLDHARKRVANASSGLGHFGQYDVRQAQLETGVERHKTAVASYTKSVDDLTLREMAEHDPVQVIAAASSAQQVAPRKVNNIVYATIVGLLLGFCFALLQEYLDDRINTSDDARRLIDVPSLGFIPMVEDQSSLLLNRAHGGGTLLESYRVMRTNVRFASVDNPMTCLMVTSTIPGEGKSVTATNLAVAMALDGYSVILVDSDLRRPSLHTKFDVQMRPGLTNVLVGHTPLEEALHETGIHGLRLLTAGPLPPNPPEILNSKAMQQLLRDLREQADLVVLDTPPLLATADAQVLSAHVDGLLYVMQFGAVKKTAVRHAAELIRQTRANVLGVVFNKIDLTSRRDEYYGYYRYYDYYSSPDLLEGRGQRHREFNALASNGKGTLDHEAATALAPAGEPGGEEEA